jgi:hemerythrin
MTLNQLHDLLDTASEHFSHEESFLKSRDNQDLLKHIGTHGFMLNQLYSLMLAITGQQNSRFSAEDIRQYWIEHFRHEAQKLRQHH